MHSNNAKTINCLAKKAIRLINNLPGKDTAQLFIENDILTLKELIEFTILTFMFDFVKGNLPLAFDAHWSVNGQINLNNYALRNVDDFFIPHTVYKYLDLHPLYNFSKLLNVLPSNVKLIHNRKEFENSIRNILVKM